MYWIKKVNWVCFWPIKGCSVCSGKNKTVTEYSDWILRGFCSLIYYFVTSYCFLVWLILDCPSPMHPCVQEVRKRRTEKGRRWRERRGMSLCNYPDFLGKPTWPEDSISLWGQHRGSYFPLQLLSLFILPIPWSA